MYDVHKGRFRKAFILAQKAKGNLKLYASIAGKN